MRMIVTILVIIMMIIIPLGLQIAQSRPYLHTLGPNVGII